MPTRRRSFPPAFSILILLFALVLPASAGEIVPELNAVLQTLPPTESVPVIVAFHGKADLQPFRAQVKALRTAGIARALRQTAEENQKNVRDLLRGRGKPFAELWIINGLAVQADPELIRTLAARPEVASIEPDRTFEMPKILPGQAGVQGNIEVVRAPDLWAQGVTGQGVTVAILDSGVNGNHPDLQPRWRGGSNSWFDPYLGTTFPYDPDDPEGPDGHGTLVAGIIVGGSAGGPAIGVAPGANWIAAKIFNDAGIAVNSQILASLQWVLDPDRNPATDDAPDVVNNSWGFEEDPGVCDSFFRTAIQNLKAAGILVVFSAGNAGPGASTAVSPANYPESFAVGSINSALTVSGFSSRGPSTCDDTIYPEVVAPGENIRSASRLGGYAVVSGTSFSAPHVSGVMALLRSAFNDASPAQIEDALMSSARDLGPPGADNGYGYGLVDALAAFQRLGANTPPPVAQLVAPAAGARDLVSPVTFEWMQPPDADGDPLTGTVLLSRSSDFQGAVQLNASVFYGSTALLASACGLLLGGLAAGRRLRRVRLLFLSLAVLLLLLACGGGGSSSSSSETILRTEAQVDPATTYFWKVVTRDNRGGVAESEVRTFATR